MVRGDVLRIRAMFYGKFNGLQVGFDGFAETPLRNQDISQGKGAGKGSC